MKIFAHKRPWYADGLGFQCQHCGRCCAGPEEGYVWVSEEEILAIAEYLGITPEQMRRKVRRVNHRYTIVEDPATRDCAFLEGGSNGSRGCLIYPVRPAQCRTWPFWASNLYHPEAWAEAGQRCIGINRGCLIGYDEIEARRLATRE